MSDRSRRPDNSLLLIQTKKAATVRKSRSDSRPVNACENTSAKAP